MNKVLLSLLFLICAYTGFSQNNPRPSRSRFWNSKFSTFSIKQGDILVYHANNNSEDFDYIVTVKKYGDGISYSYAIPTKSFDASTNLTATTVKSGVKYESNFAEGNKTPVWLSKKNFDELTADKETEMDFGNGTESYVRKNTTTMKINYKGKQKIITIYNIESQSQTNKRSFAVLTEPNNPLIVSINAGYTITLKEVR